MQPAEMELLSSSQEENVYGLDSATEEENKNWSSKKAFPGCGGGKSLASSYTKVALFGMGAHLISVAYFVLISLTTSYNADLGSYSLAAMYASQIVSLLVTPSLVNIVGSKACSVLSGLCALVFASSYMYPSWYTIMPSSLVQGFACGLIFATLVVTKNDEVRKVVEEKKVDEVAYHGRFGAICSVAFNSSAIVAGIITIATLSDQDDGLPAHNATGSGNASVSQNATEQPFLQACAATSSTTSATSSNYTIHYYILVGVCTLATLLSIVIFSIGEGAAYHQCRVCSFGLRSALRDIVTYAVRVLKQATTPAYGMTLPLWLLHGTLTAYFFGVFTKMYISECVGVAFVGVSVIIWGLSTCLGSFLSGWLIHYTTSCVIVTTVIGLGYVGSSVFLLAWMRQPNLVVICTMAAIYGLCHGVIFQAALVYIGIAPGYSQEIGNCLVFICAGIGNSVQFVLSEYISAQANLYTLLTLSLLAAHLFAIADSHFGSGCGRRTCCSRIREEQAVERPTDEEHEHTDSTDTSTSSSVSADCAVVINVSINMSDREDGCHFIKWKESPV